MSDVIFQPLSFRNLTVKNRVFRSNISGRFDNYDGSGSQVRINWETKFARGGVGAIISSFVPVHPRGRIIPNYATIHKDDRIPFWRKVGEAVLCIAANPGAPFDRAKMIQPEVMITPLCWLTSDDAADISGKRFVATQWDVTLPPREAALRCAAPAAWSDAGSKPREPERTE